jgi:hypothetical protein
VNGIGPHPNTIMAVVEIDEMRYRSKRDVTISRYFEVELLQKQRFIARHRYGRALGPG